MRRYGCSDGQEVLRVRRAGDADGEGCRTGKCHLYSLPRRVGSNATGIQGGSRGFFLQQIVAVRIRIRIHIDDMEEPEFVGCLVEKAGSRYLF